MADTPTYPLKYAGSAAPDSWTYRQTVGWPACCGNCIHWRRPPDPSAFGVCGNQNCYPFPISGPNMPPNVTALMMATTDLTSCTRWELAPSNV